jgi:hypothetical protein
MNLLTINGIHKLVGCKYLNRDVCEVYENYKFKTNYYVIKFSKLPNVPTYLLTWGEEIEVFLERERNEVGKYEIYVMGWHQMSCTSISFSEIRDIAQFEKTLTSVLKSVYDHYTVI